MKILRIRRGFTTNSSGANEYITPGSETTPPLENQPGGVAVPQAQPVAPVKPAAAPAAPPGEGMTGAATGQPVSCREACRGSTTIGNAFILGTFILCVLLLFAVERIVRLVRRRLGKGSHER